MLTALYGAYVDLKKVEGVMVVDNHSYDTRYSQTVGPINENGHRTQRTGPKDIVMITWNGRVQFNITRDLEIIHKKVNDEMMWCVYDKGSYTEKVERVLAEVVALVNG